jgi:hypothetical protein
LYETYAYTFAGNVLNPSDSSWRNGKANDRPWSWFNLIDGHPSWLKERMNNWPDSSFWYRSEDRSFAVLTPNQQKVLCGEDPNGHEVSCAALNSDSPIPEN